MLYIDKKSQINSPFELFTSQAIKNPKSAAVISSNEVITYDDLKKSVDNLSKKLIQTYLLEKNDIVAIALMPSIEFITLTLACLKCGITYIPLNLDYPDTYIKKILDDSMPKIIITEQAHLKRQAFHEQHKVSLTQQELDCNILKKSNTTNSNDNSYIIYTSGSTGNPKGVIIKNESIINLMQSTKDIFKINTKDKIPLFHSLAFDFSIWEIYSSIFNGATLIIPTEEEKVSISGYIDFIKNNEISVINLTPSIFYHLTISLEKNNVNIPSLKKIILGGESFIPKKAKKWFDTNISKHSTLYNMYGITEGTIHTTIAKITNNLKNSNDSYIGDPLDGINIGILDKSNTLSFDNSEGELCISGHGLTRGYLNDEKLSKDKFFTSQNKLWFKTGDWVKRENTRLFYLNRIDKLIKIRGFRVSCREIESLLIDIHGISNSFVTTYKTTTKDTRIVAFIENNQKNISQLKIKNIIKNNLPNFMMPTKFIILENFPITKNGKTDIKQLNKKIKNSPLDKNEETQNEKSIEEIVINTWKNLLGIDHVGINENFFDAGGDSLLLIKLQYLLSSNLQTNIKLSDLIRYSSINSFMQHWDSIKNYEKIKY